jgi:ribosome maturation factor RimP
MTDIATLTALIEPEADALGLKIVRIAMFGGTSDPTLQVMAERPDTRQLILDDCATLSRRLSEVLDEHDPIEHAYRLEVSSPGIDRPLTRLSDYADWTGHMARIRVEEAIDGRKQFEGELRGLDGENVILDVAKIGETRLPFAAIVNAKLLLTDKLIQATAPLSPEGADKILQEG